MTDAATGRNRPPAPLTVERIREAVEALRVEYLPLMTGHPIDEDWRDATDVAEHLATLLEALGNAKLVGFPGALDTLIPKTIARIDDAFAALVEKILGARA